MRSTERQRVNHHGGNTKNQARSIALQLARGAEVTYVCSTMQRSHAMWQRLEKLMQRSSSVIKWQPLFKTIICNPTSLGERSAEDQSAASNND